MDNPGAEYIPRGDQGQRTAIRHLETLSHLLDRAFRVPGTNMRFGLDPLIGLVPGLGDVISALLGIYSLWIARQVGAPSSVQARMLMNLGIDGFIGLVPIAGDLFDFAFKAHSRNHALIKRWMQAPHSTQRSSWMVLGTAALVLLILLWAAGWLLVSALHWAAGLLG